MYPHERSLVQKFAGRPFAIVGVNSDRDREMLKEVMEKEQITWRSFWCGPEGTRGPIPAKWNVQGWPTLYYLDHKGVIRAKNLRDERQVEELLEKLVAEAEADAGKQK
jgi:hypothetical protein